MGVPKFFRYTSERYPCLNELVKQYQIPDFDNMYLDMNGIIHNCSHPDDSNPHFRITEEKIFKDIFHYLSMLFQIIKPKKLFFMAIDGVAPRAKMNQQRGRRFRSAREAEKLEEDAKAKGEKLPTEKRFDSNCITPGTVFMARLHEQLRYFIKHKMSTDPLWSKVKVILSGHETPGEGEHKIMDYIRWARSQPNYDPNTRHCLYGLDADLIMLGMCTHEPHFALLREEVKFGKTTQRATSPEETNFYLLHLSLLREYLEQEFITLKDNLPFPYDIEKIVDDWVLMGFLVGNDFIPNLPNMHISNDALPLLYKTYMTVLPTLNGYINEAGDLNLERFEIFMQELAKIDKEKFQDTYADLKYFEAKTGRRPNANERKEYKPNNDETFNVNIEDIKANKPDDELQALINATHDMMMDDLDDNEEYEETSDEEANIEMEFKLHKKDYYINKLDYSKVTDEVLADQAEGYVRAIQWNLFYYYKGCPSWCWYYPHHYAPYMSDIKGFKDLKIEFELGEPFKPFEQLLAVLPAASKQLLPAPFHDLMTDEDSPIVHYYPINFETDLNGKRNDWEAVVLIPFIDETNLLSAMAPCYQRLTEEEHKRNTHGPMLVYNWTSQSQGTVQAPEYFPPITDCHSKEARVWRRELEVPDEQLKRGMLPNAKRDMLFPGFPTMRHLKYKTVLKKGKVKVFDLPSKNDNMIVELISDENENLKSTEDNLEKIAHEYLGKVIWVGWPHLTRAKVISVSNEKMRLHHIDQQNNNENGLPSYSTEHNNGNLHKQWKMEKSTIVEHNFHRLGIELGDLTTIIHAVSLKGFKYLVKGDSRIAQEPEWYTIPCGYAHQAVLKDVSTYIMDEPNRFSTAIEAYPPGDHVFLLTQGPHYGCLATVVDSDGLKSGRIRVQVKERPEPTPDCAYVSVAPYKSAGHAAAACGISAQMLSRITGTVFVVPGERNNRPTEELNKINVGLNLKFNKKNLQVSGYTRRCSVSNSWLYSQRCIDLVKSYEKEFPELFDSLAQHLNRDIFFESDLWPNSMGTKKAEDIAKWLKSQPHTSASRTECGSEALEPEEMKALANDIDKQMLEIKTREKKVTLQVKWNLLYKPELHEGNIQPDPKADFKIYDRVVSVGRNITAPFGATGTITAIYRPPVANTVRLSDKLNAEPTYQVMFDEPFPGAITEELFDQPRFYRMLPTNMLNISFGRKLRRNISNSMGEQDSFGYSNNTPNVLRREDGHHSAFASYSPPVDKKSPQMDNRNILLNTVTSNGQSQDNATHLLRSLLKISETKTDFTEQNKNIPETNQNWRSRNDNNIQISPQRMQQQNWRKENATFNPRPPQQQMYSNDWTNSSYKAVPPPAVPPYPSFGQPFPGTSQMPFPFQNPHFQQRNFFQNNQRPPYGQPQAQAPHIQPLQTQPTHMQSPQAQPLHIQQPQAQPSNLQPLQAQQPLLQQPQTQPPNLQQLQAQPLQAQPLQAQPLQAQPLQAQPLQTQSSHIQPPQSQPPNLQQPQAQLPNLQPLQAQPPQSQLQVNFPNHLPSVYSRNITLGPSWIKGPPLQSVPNTNQPPTLNPQQNSSDRINNPFVPLQVQTSQRKVQNTGGASLRRDSKDIAVPKVILQKPQPTEPPVTQQQQSTSSKNVKKKKPRIAANLPFQID